MSNNWIYTISGTAFDFVDLKPSMIKVSDFVYAIAREKRYSNHTILPVSVLEHSLNVSSLLSEKFATEFGTKEQYKRMELIGLLHDASEAYTRDLSRPMKELCPGFREVEDRISSAIYTKYLGRDITKDEEAILKLADNMSLKDESKSFLPREDEGMEFWIHDVPDFPENFTPVYGLSEEEAELMFFRKFNTLLRH